MPDWVNTVYMIGGAIAALALIGALWRILETQGESGWLACVPFYNIWLINKWNGSSGWLFLLIFLPYIGTAYVAFVFFQLCRNYGRSVGFSIGGALLPSIFLPIMAFGRGGPDDSRAQYEYKPPAARQDDPPERSARPVASARPVVSTPAVSAPMDLMAPPPSAAGAEHAPSPHKPAKPLEENLDVLPELARFDNEMRSRLAAGESMDNLSWELLDRTHEISRRDVVAHLQRLK